MCNVYIYADILMWYNIMVNLDWRYDMPATKAQQKAVNKYMAANYDRINLTTPKGKRKLIQEHAKSHGESANEFINRAIDEAMERDSADTKK